MMALPRKFFTSTGAYDAWTCASPFNPSMTTLLCDADRVRSPCIDANRTEPSDELIFRSPLTCWALIEVPVPTIASDAALITSMVEAPDLIVELSIRFVALILEDDASSLT